MQWEKVTLLESYMISNDIKYFRFKAGTEFLFNPGQYVNLKITDIGGMQAARSYSMMSTPSLLPEVEFGVQIIPDGIVTSFMNMMKPGDQLEMMGPIGRYFMLAPGETRDLVLIGGGAGVIPLLSIYFHAAEKGYNSKVKMLYSAKSAGDVIYLDKLRKIESTRENFEMNLTLTREEDSAVANGFGRYNAEKLKEELASFDTNALFFICGMTSFVEDIGDVLRAIGFGSSEIRTERFG